MERTPNGTSVGVDDPYEFAGVCDHLTGEGQCRYAFDYYEHDPEFARERADEDYACPVVDPETDETWADCPHFRSRNRDRECVRCGLAEKRLAHDDERPLLEEHHLSYNDGHRPSSNQNATRSEDANDGETLSHEITVYLCRWCHAKVHNSWARITDDAAPDPEATAELEGRRGRERDEFGFESAAERYDRADREE
ncbi:hypothetical protein [Natrialba sp. PRR66]|uniref:DUF7097 family protein n=1 Tax=Natrialba sp. PRR66 TaxID=3098146 RepID=UPI002B1D7735|nr:hypothetical protein [Natrialba sp. PRR66]